MDQGLTILITPNQRTILFLQNLAKIGSIIVAAIGLLNLLTWYFGIRLPINFLPNVTDMKPLISIGFICAASALFLHLINNLPKKIVWESVTSSALSCFTLILGFVPLIVVIIQSVLSIKVPSWSGGLFGDNIFLNLSFIFTGVALLLLPIPAGKHYMRVAHILIFIVALLSMFTIISYLYETLSIYTIFPVIHMSLSSSLTFTIFCLSFIFARSNRGYSKVFTRNTPSSILALRLIFIVLTLPVILGFIILQGEQLRIYDAQVGLTLFVVSSLSLFSIAIWVNSSALQKLELENSIIKNQLEKKSFKLEIDSQALASKLLSMEEEKRAAYDKLSNQEKLIDIIGTSE